MKEEVTFQCEYCRKKIKVLNGKIPECCDKPMKKVSLDVCTQPAHAEHARPMENEDVCDDGRAGE